MAAANYFFFARFFSEGYYILIQCLANIDRVVAADILRKPLREVSVSRESLAARASRVAKIPY